MIRGPPWPRGLYRDLDSVNPKAAPAGVGGQPWGRPWSDGRASETPSVRGH